MVEAAFYGDDFTGSTDALAQFARVGLRAALLVTLPSASALCELATRYDVIGVAGIARSLPPDEQEAELRPVLEAFRELGPRVVQYKVCSTADSAPGRGSIGRALEVGRDVFGPAPVPILVAQPELGRYTTFSHHFAAEAGTIHRLDRQPTMSTHPSTPMHESDLRRHVAAQTSLRIEALHLTSYPSLPQSYATLTAAPVDAVDAVDAVVLDALTDEDLRALGRAILQQGARQPIFAIGSGGLSRALALDLCPADPKPTTSPPAIGGGEPVLVVSGSQSRRTAEQIEDARTKEWAVLGLADDAATRAVAAFDAGADGVVVHTNDLPREDLAAVPSGLAQVVRRVTREAGVRRVVVAGGDTSGQVLRQLELSALELVDTTAPGVQRCRAVSGVQELDGLEVLLKPGQLGDVDLFSTYRNS
ncbi:four-carbon acid sugar kinase family protein [Kribbella sp. NPDC054772]